MAATNAAEPTHPTSLKMPRCGFFPNGTTNAAEPTHPTSLPTNASNIQHGRESSADTPCTPLPLSPWDSGPFLAFENLYMLLCMLGALLQGM